MKGYKAFSKGLVCRGKQYAENTVFEEENAEIGRSGMHFCKNLLDVLDYRPLVDNEGNITEFAEVEALDDVKTHDGEEFCTKKLKIGSKLSLSQFIEASFNFASQNIKSQAEASDGETLAGGDWAKLIGDDDAKLIGGNGAKLIGDDDAKLIGGNGATLVGDNYAKLVGGNGATLVGGYLTKLIGGHDATLVSGSYAELVGAPGAKLIGGDNTKLVGDYGTKLIGGGYAELVGGNDTTLVGGNNTKLVGGDYAKLVGDNDATLAGGKNAVIVGDHGSAAKGKKGAIIVLVERDAKSNIVNFKTVQVDGEKIKEDVLYQLENGEFVEVEE